MTSHNAVNTTLSGQSGNGAFAGSISAVFVAPTLGDAVATSINFGGTTLNIYSALQTWTPAFTFSTPGDLSVSYSVQNGYYSRIGNIVHAVFQLSCVPTFTTAASYAQISGLPFALNASINACNSTCSTAGTFTYGTGATTCALQMQGGGSMMYMQGTGPGVFATLMTVSQFISGNSVTVNGNITYLV